MVGIRHDLGYLELLITRHILPSPLKFEVSRVDCTGLIKLVATVFKTNAYKCHFRYGVEWMSGILTSKV